MKLFFILLLSFFIVSCTDQKVQQIPESEIIAVVGEEVITADLLKASLVANGIVQANDAIIGKALEKLIEEISMANIAKKKKLSLNAEQLNTLKYIEIKSLASAAKQDYLNNNELSDEELKKEYQNTNKQTGGIEFHVHHLLYKDEIQAIKKLETLKTTEDFLLAETLFLKEFPNMNNVGDLSWVTLGQLPKSFRDVLPAQEEKTIYPQVLNSQFGAHIVYLEGIRKLQPPKFEDVKDGIVETLKARKLSKFSQLAKAKAHVIIKE